jgi:hypothetical protein
MKKVLLFVLMAMVSAPLELFADQYNCDEVVLPKPPVRTPNSVEAWINSETGEFSIYANYDITCLYVTVEQNNVVLDSFSCPISNGIPATYDFSVYPTGEYLVTLSTADGIISQYCVTVEHD